MKRERCGINSPGTTGTNRISCLFGGFISVREKSIALLVLCFLLLPGIVPALAHTPLTAGENENLMSATAIENTEKSWVVYGYLREAGDLAYYRLDMHPGQRLVLAVNSNTGDAPVPDLIVMGPGIESSGIPPPSLQIPPGSGVRVIPGTPPPRGEYEPFSPSVIYEVATFSLPVSREGTYYGVVSTPEDGVHYSLVAGYKEEFSVGEWLLIPFSVVGIYQWEGQPLAVVLAPLAMVLAIGIGVLLWQQSRGSGRPVRGWLLSLGGLLYAGGAAITFTQMVRALSITGFSPAASLTCLFVAIPALLGIGSLRMGRTTPSPHLRSRLLLAAIGGLGFLFWAGYLIGPLLILGAALLPGGEPDIRSVR